MPTSDAANRVHHLPTSLYELKDWRMTRFDVPSDIGHQENDEDMSSRRVPSSFLPLAAGRRIMTSTTSTLTVDASNRIHNPSIGCYKPTQPGTMHYNYVVSQG